MRWGWCVCVWMLLDAAAAAAVYPPQLRDSNRPTPRIDTVESYRECFFFLFHLFCFWWVPRTAGPRLSGGCQWQQQRTSSTAERTRYKKREKKKKEKKKKRTRHRHVNMCVTYRKTGKNTDWEKERTFLMMVECVSLHEGSQNSAHCSVLHKMNLPVSSIFVLLGHWCFRLVEIECSHLCLDWRVEQACVIWEADSICLTLSIVGPAKQTTLKLGN